MINRRFQINKFYGGFTIVELIVSMGILMMLFALTSINLSNLPSSANQQSQTEILISDIKHQQALSMAGVLGSSGGAEHGIYFESGRYTLFTGDGYDPNDTGNFVVDLEGPLQFGNVTWPENTIVFLNPEGEISNYTAGMDSITIINNQTGEEKILRLNRYGSSY